MKFLPTAKKDRELEHISKPSKQLFLRIAKIKNRMKVTHFHERLNPIQLKGKRDPLYLLDSIKTELNWLKKHIKKLKICDED